MVERVLPKLTPANHETFFNLINADFPDTYDKWLNVHTNEITKETLVNRNTVREIEVNPYEFARYCRSLRAACDLANLLQFAIEKAYGNKY